MKASVCLEMIYTEFPFMERIKIAADQGFDAIEFWTWDNKDMNAIKEAVDLLGLEIAAFQSNRSGTMIEPDHRENFISGIKESLNMASQVDAKNMFLLTDELGDDRSVKYQFPDLSEEEKYQSVYEGLVTLAPFAEAANVTLVLEPLNNLVDHAGYWLKDSDVGLDLVRKINSPNIKLLFDIYHQQITEGNIIERLINNLDDIGYVHIADVPGRHEPGTGELNYVNILKELKNAGYDGFVGFEFSPTLPSKDVALSTLKLLK